MNPIPVVMVAVLVVSIIFAWKVSGRRIGH